MTILSSSRSGVVRRRQSGQMMVEYAVIAAVLAGALFAPFPGSQESVSQLLCDSIRNLYTSMTQFVSLP
jgi:Flp pilus assembly pilin Flp